MSFAPAAFADHALEGRHVQLAERSLGDVYLEGLAFRLRVVANVMLGAAADAARLQAEDVGSGHPAGEQRVLGELLEMPATDGAALEVDRGAEQHVYALTARFAGEQLAQLTNQPFVPAGRQGGGARQTRRGLVVAGGTALHSGRTVRNDHRAKPRLGRFVHGPEVHASQEANLRFEVQARQPAFDRALDDSRIV